MPTIDLNRRRMAAPGGYTLVFGNTGLNAMVSLLRKVPYDSVRDLASISTAALMPMLLAVSADRR